MALGTIDLKLVSLPSAWDAAELNRLRLRDGKTYAEMIADIEAALSIFNGSMMTGWLANLISTTDSPEVEYRQGATTSFQLETEYGQPDAQHGDITGHMLPLKGMNYKLEWTNLALENARSTRLDADIAVMLDAARNAWEQSILERLFKMEEETGKAFGLGATGYSVPFADGGAGTVAFTPPQRTDRASAFASTHDHFLRLDGITQANVETAVNHLWEHGHDAPFVIIASDADRAAWTNVTNVTGYKARASAGIVYGISESLADVSEEYTGAIVTQRGTAWLRLNARIPTGYWGVVKVYGSNDSRNPLKVRYDEMMGLGVRLAVGTMNLYPLSGAIPRFKFGVGVGMDRTAAVLVENDSSGDYATPTIS